MASRKMHQGSTIKVSGKRFLYVAEYITNPPALRHAQEVRDMGFPAVVRVKRDTKHDNPKKTRYVVYSR